MTSTGIFQRFLDKRFHQARHDKRPTISSDIPISNWGVVDPKDLDPSSFPPYSEAEARLYYAGLPSNPVLVYRTGTTPWKRPTGPEAYRELKELKPVFSHKIVAVWANLGVNVYTCLDSLRVTWTSVDVVRFAVVGKAPGPPVLWIGVVPQSLTRKEAHVAAIHCQELLKRYGITDVEVEFRESVVTRLASLKLLESVPSSDPTVAVRGPLTPVLGLQIAARATPNIEGTGALYIADGRDRNRVYILTARHVLFSSYDFIGGGWHRRQVLLLGRGAFQAVLKSTMVKIDKAKIMAKYYSEQLSGMEGDDAKGWTKLEDDLMKEEMSLKALNRFHDEVMKFWSKESERVIGHIAYSPPLAFSASVAGHAEDWALIELDRNKIDWATFKGNVIDLGTDISVDDFIFRMCANSVAHISFQYPSNRLLPVQGIIERGELYSLRVSDDDGKPRLIVIKNGLATGLTIGCANGVHSIVRAYTPDGAVETSLEWAILPYNQESGAFSAAGDSGAIIVDGKGRIGGLLTCGTGRSESIDITYATPFYWLWQRIQARFPNCSLYQPTA